MTIDDLKNRGYYKIARAAEKYYLESDWTIETPLNITDVTYLFDFDKTKEGCTFWSSVSFDSNIDSLLVEYPQFKEEHTPLKKRYRLKTEDELRSEDLWDEVNSCPHGWYPATTDLSIGEEVYCHEDPTINGYYDSNCFYYPTYWFTEIIEEPKITLEGTYDPAPGLSVVDSGLTMTEDGGITYNLKKGDNPLPMSEDVNLNVNENYEKGREASIQVDGKSIGGEKIKKRLPISKEAERGRHIRGREISGSSRRQVGRGRVIDGGRVE